MTIDFVDPWAGQGLTFYSVWAKDESYEDRSLDVVASSPEQAMQLWRRHYRGWDLTNIEHGPEVRTRALPAAVGRIKWSHGPDVPFERRARRWSRKSACAFKRIDWVRA
jgi:hypothetical protein